MHVKHENIHKKNTQHYTATAYGLFKENARKQAQVDDSKTTSCHAVTSENVQHTEASWLFLLPRPLERQLSWAAFHIILATTGNRDSGSSDPSNQDLLRGSANIQNISEVEIYVLFLYDALPHRVRSCFHGYV